MNNDLDSRVCYTRDPHVRSTRQDCSNSSRELPLVSIVIPAYNAERFIEQTLGSAVQQTYPNKEILVVDDGSTDKTKAIAEKVATRDQCLRIYSVPNAGVAKARNLGIDKARGEFVAFLDADDLWHPAKIELQVLALLRESSESRMAAVYTLSRVINADDQVLFDGNQVVFSGYTFTRHLYRKPVGNCSSIMVRREAAIAVEGFDPTYAARSLGGSEDLDFELKITGRYLVTSVPLYLVGYRVSAGNMSSDKVRMARATVETIKRHIDMHPELPEFAIRASLAAVREDTFSVLVTGRHWLPAGREFCRLSLADAALAFHAVSSKCNRVIKRSLQSRVEPLFQTLDPAPGEDPGMNPLNSHKRRTLCRLKTIDEALSKQMDREDRG